MIDDKLPSLEQLEAMLKEMAKTHPDQQGKQLPQIQPGSVDQKIQVKRGAFAPQKKIKKATQKGQ